MGKRGPQKGTKYEGTAKSKVDLDELREFLKMPHTIVDCQAKFGVSYNTINRLLAEKTGKTFGEFADECLFSLRSQLKGEAIRMALGRSFDGKTKVKDGDKTMLNKCLDNICNWSDKVEQTNKDGDQELTDEQLRSRIESMLNARKK